MNATLTMPSIQEVWHTHAPELAEWAMARVVNRTDAYGGYKSLEIRDKIDNSTGKPFGKNTTRHRTLTTKALQLHFECKRIEWVVGVHAISDRITNTCKWFAFDFDNHASDEIHATNEDNAKRLFAYLQTLGFSPLLLPSDDKGGFHLWVLLNTPTPSRDVFHFCKTVRKESAIPEKTEFFPKQEQLTEGTPLGNWMRLFGRHHTREVFADRVWNGTQWLTDNAMIDFILSHQGDTAAVAAAPPVPPRKPITFKEFSSADEARHAFQIARKYISKMEPSIDGQHGHDKALAAACECRRFGLDKSYAMTLLHEFNARCQPAWSDAELERKYDEAVKKVPNAGERLDSLKLYKAARTSARALEDTGKPMGRVAEMVAEMSSAATPIAAPAENLKPPEHDPILSPSPSHLKTKTEESPTPAEPQLPPPTPPTSVGIKPTPEFRPDPKDIVEYPHPLPMADHFITHQYFNSEGFITLQRYREEWWEYTGSGYRQTSDEQMTAEVYQHLERLWTPSRDNEGEVLPDQFTKIIPKSGNVGEVIKALPSRGILLEGQIPQWLGGRKTPPPENIVAFKNGLLDVEAYRTSANGFMPPTAAWFSGVACPYNFDPDAKCPLWLKTIDDIFDGDNESIELLQEWCGYLLVPDNRYEKFMMQVGPPRSGKGTTLSVIEDLLGADQIATTSFTKLASRFGMHPLMGKLGAVLPDAHITKNTDAMAALETLKSITGNDAQAIDRKGIDELPTVRLFCRFTVAVNSLPELPDDAGALKPRLLLLHYTKSYANNTDDTLKQRLKAETPGIALWALEGLCRLREQERFTLPARSKKMIDAFDRILSPILSFLDERCELGDPQNFWVAKDDAYAKWVEWCKDRGDAPGNKAAFGQALVNSNSGIAPCKRGPRGSQFSAYEGFKIL